MKIKTIKNKADEIDQKAKDFSLEMGKREYTITAEKLNPGLKKMWRPIRMMGFKNAETEAILDSVRKDLVGKEMKKGDDFKALMTEAFTKAITNAVEGVKEGK